MLKKLIKRTSAAIKVRRNEWEDIYKHTRLGEIPWQTFKPEKHLVDLVEKGKIKQGRALDMCCGAGTNSIYLASRGFEVYGIDISPTAVKKARLRCKSEGLKCRYYVGDVLTAEFDGKFDFVFDRGCFHHIEKKDKPFYVKRVHDFLNPKGQFFLQCFSDKNKWFWKSLSKEDIYSYFSPYFSIKLMKESVHKEPDSGEKVWLWSIFMEKRGNHE